MQASGALTGMMDSLQLSVHDTIEVYARGAATMAAQSIDASMQEDASLAAGGALSVAGQSAKLEVQAGLGVTAAAATVRIEEGMSVYAGERVDLNTHDVDLQAGGTGSAFAGDKATLVAGAGGISADSAGDVKIRTGDHSLELDSAGPARLMSKGQIRLDSRTLAATAGEVALTGGNSNADIARLTVQLDCTVSPEADVFNAR